LRNLMFSSCGMLDKTEVHFRRQCHLPVLVAND
jgi:hypothetical protein